MSRSAIQSQIEKILECPINWPSITGLPADSHEWLKFDWYRCVRDTAVSIDEQAAISDMAAFGKLTIGDHDTHVLTNLRLRMPESLALFETRSKKLARLTFLSPSHDGKHFKPGLNHDSVLKRSKGSPSLFFLDHTPQQMRDAFWAWFSFFFDTSLSFDEFYERDETACGYDAAVFAIWDKFEERYNFRTACSCIKAIGAVVGVPSEYVCFDIELATPTVHAYPISEDEARAIMPLDSLLGVRAFG